MQWGRGAIKQIKTENMEEHWSDVHTEPDRPSRSVGHNKVHANKSMGRHACIMKGMVSLLTLILTFPFADMNTSFILGNSQADK